MTDFNLLTEPWLPVRRRSGAQEWIAPAGLTSRYDDDPIIALSSPRPDFNGALTQFLIGLLQTCSPARGEVEWLKRLQSPPSPQEIESSTAPYILAFNLFGDGPRFMQDLEGFESSSNAIMELMIEIPAGNTLAKNADLFVKRTASDDGLCLAAAAAALLTMQLNSPSGGAGYRTSIRGGGPLTTLIAAETLWQTVWLNTMPQDKFNGIHNIPKPPQELAAIFPWMAPTRTSAAVNKGGLGLDTGPEHVNPLQIFWAMPRRIRLDTPAEEPGVCAFYGGLTPLVRSFIQTNYGVNYTGPWRHPLSPYSITKDGDYIARKGQPRCLEYRHWPQLAARVNHGEQQIASPLNMLLELREDYEDELELFQGQLHIWTFGYDMDNAKVRNWYEGVIPTYVAPSEDAQLALGALATNLIDVATLVQDALIQAIQRAMFGTCELTKTGKTTWSLREGVSKTQSLFEAVAIELWRTTEADFYDTLAQTLPLLDDAQALDELKQRWLSTLRGCAMTIFESRTPSEISCDADIKARTIAQSELPRFINPKAKKIQDALGLLSPPTPPEVTT